MYQLNEKLIKLSPYDPIEGNFKIRLDANESPYNLPDDLKKEITNRITQLNINRYPDPMAKSVVEAFAKYYNINPDCVTAGNGSDELISIIENCFLQKGDKILSLSNDFSMYRFYAQLSELENVVLQKEGDLSINVDKIISACNADKSIKAMIFSNPCNPTSLGITANEVKKLIKSVNCLVIVDEAYMDFWNESILNCVEEFDNLIILKTCSKAIGAAGIRLGFAIAGKTITNAIRAAKSPYNTDSISQLIGTVLFEEQNWLKTANAQIIENTKALYQGICKICIETNNTVLKTPQKPCTNFVFIQSDFCNEIFDKLSKKSIAIRNFGTYLRICSGTETENNILITALNEICHEIYSAGGAC